FYLVHFRVSSHPYHRALQPFPTRRSSDLHRRGEVQQPDEPEETREVAGPVDYPTELPVAAEPTEEPVIWQPIVVTGFGILLLVAVLAFIFSARKRADKH